MFVSNVLLPGMAAQSEILKEGYKSEIGLGYITSSQQFELQNQVLVSNFFLWKCFNHWR